MTFATDIAKFLTKTDRRVNSVVKKIVIDLGTKIILRTPVGNPSMWQDPDGAPVGYAGGQARANWQYGNGNMPSGTLDTIDKAGSSTVNKIISGVQASRAASVHWVTNNLPYINRLENGWSRQAPQGMVRLSVMEFKQVVKDAIKNVN